MQVKNILQIAVVCAFLSIPRGDLIETVQIPGEITAENHQLAALDSHSDYKFHSTFQSPEIESDFDFTTVGLTWDADLPRGTNIQGEVSFKTSDGWSEWLFLAPERDHEKMVATASTNPAESFKYRFHFYSDGISRPTVSNVEYTFLKSFVMPEPIIKLFTIEPVKRTAQIKYNGKIISRQQWGANESYRLLKNNSDDPVLAEIDAHKIAQFKDELKYSRVVKKDSRGRKYRWPLQYPEKVRKIVIHHTAGTKNLNNPGQAVRDIYTFHTNTRGWGDIGYNYIMDLDGRLYEGRAGGEGVIGAHAGLANNGTIGIAVLGNYDQAKAPEKVVKSLQGFIAEKASIHKIDPKGSSIFRGEMTANVFGHKDVAGTACPGAHLYSKIDMLRQAAQVKTVEKFKEPYAFLDQSAASYIDLKPNQTREFTLKLQNIGKQTWGSNTFIVVNRDPSHAGTVSFPTRRGSRLAPMKERQVKPGDTATFKFKVKAGTKAKDIQLDITPIFNGGHKLKEYVEIPVNLAHPEYNYQFLSATYPPKTLKPGQKFRAKVSLKNTGNIDWNKGTALGTSQPQDRKSEFINGTRFAKLSGVKVAPGAIGSFDFTLTAPRTPGFYKEYFTPLVEGKEWMKDQGLHFETTVIGNGIHAQYAGESDASSWQRGKKYVAWIKMRNVGTKTWKHDMKFKFLSDQNLQISDARLASAEVKSGEIGTVEFTVKVGDSTPLGFEKLQVRSPLTKMPVKFGYVISENTDVKHREDLKATKQGLGAEGDIRIHLSKFTGAPQITANGTFDVYSGARKLTTLTANRLVSVSYDGSKYRVKAGNKNFSASQEIRIIPRNKRILRIANFQNNPAWNASLNDNIYRGTLEVRQYAGKLVVINELPLEDYLRGLAEISNTAHTEKIKSIIVAARSYARYYMDIDNKFPGAPYHLDDSPERSQKYLGYGFEKRSPKVAASVRATTGEVITYNGAVVKAPYFSKSNGTRTRSAADVWGWAHTPYLKSVDDSHCRATAFAGHGVGMSGCGATALASQGFTYKQILKHYYTGVGVEKK